MTTQLAGPSKAWTVTPPPKRAWVTVWVIALAPLLFLLIALALEPEAATATGFLIAFGGSLALGAFLLACMRRREVRVEDGELRVSAAFYTRRVRVAELDLPAARIVDLREQHGLRLRWRTNGYSVPGFHAGHYRLRDGSRAFCLLTEPSPVLMLSERSGRRLLLSLEQPRSLLEALHGGNTDAR